MICRSSFGLWVCRVHGGPFRWPYRGWQCWWPAGPHIVFDVRSIVYSASRSCRRFCNAWRIRSLCAGCEEWVYCLKGNRKSWSECVKMLISMPFLVLNLCINLYLGRDCAPSTEWSDRCHDWSVWSPAAICILTHVSGRSDSIRCGCVFFPVRMGTSCGMCNCGCASE